MKSGFLARERCNDIRKGIKKTKKQKGHNSFNIFNREEQMKEIITSFLWFLLDQNQDLVFIGSKSKLSLWMYLLIPFSLKYKINIFLSFYFLFFCLGYKKQQLSKRGDHGIMVIVIGSGPSFLEFKSWTRLFAFPLTLMSLKKVWIQKFSSSYGQIVGQTVFFNPCMATSSEKEKMNLNKL